MKKLFCVLLALLLLAAQPLALAAGGEDTPPAAESGVEEETPAPPEETPEEDTSSQQPAGDPDSEPEPQPEPEPEPDSEPAPDTEPQPDLEPDSQPVSEPEPAPEVVEIPSMVAVPEEPVISVSVPDSGWVVVNPYGLEVQWEGVTSQEQIVSPELVLENQSTVPIQVNAQAVGTIPEGSGAAFASAPPAPEETEKAVFLFLEFQQTPGAWSGIFSDAPNQLLVTQAGESKTGLLTLDAGSAGYFKISGAAAVNPLTPWTGEDTIKASVAFTFTLADGAPASWVS